MADPNNNSSGKEENSTAKTFADMFNHAGDLSKTEAIKILSDHLGGSWDNLTEGDLDMSILQGGFVNRLFICENKMLVSNASKSEPSKVLLRLMGGKILDNKYAKDNILATHGEVVESLHYVLMSQANLGPKIYGVFSGGRIEEFIPSRILSDTDLGNPKITGAFARKLARIHNMSPPIVKKPKDMFGLIEAIRSDNLTDFMEKTRNTEVPKGLEAAAKLWLEFDLSAFVDWMIETFPTIKTRVVFSHNDMNRANCIIREGPGTETMAEVDKVILIDYEFCCYIWRGSDIGQHFHNRTIDVTKFTKSAMEGETDSGKVNYQSDLKYPTEEERRYFIQEYVDEVKKLGTYQIDPELESVESMLIEAEFFGLLWNLLLCMWIVRDHSKWVDKGFGGLGQMFVYLADYVTNFTERKQRIVDLKERFPNN